MSKAPHLNCSPGAAALAAHSAPGRAVRYDDIYQMDEIKSLSFHIVFYRLFCGVAKYIVYGNTFSSFELEIDRYICLPIFEHSTIVGFRFCKKIFLSHAQLYMHKYNQQ